MTSPSVLLAYLLPDPEQSALMRLLLAIAYAFAAFCWLRAWRGGRTRAAPDFSGWWLLGAVLLFLLALNKVFQFRGVCEDSFRGLAKAGGWYERRQPMQFVLAMLLPSVLAIVAAVFLATRGRAFVRSNKLALLGWILLLLYLSLRQTQEWKPILPWLERVRYYDWRLGLEAAGIGLVIAAALLAQRRA